MKHGVYSPQGPITYSALLTRLLYLVQMLSPKDWTQDLWVLLTLHVSLCANDCLSMCVCNISGPVFSFVISFLFWASYRRSAIRSILKSNGWNSTSNNNVNLNDLAFANVFCCVLALSTLLSWGPVILCGLAVLSYILYSLLRTWPHSKVQQDDSMGTNGERHSNHLASFPGEKTLSCL